MNILITGVNSQSPIGNIEVEIIKNLRNEVTAFSNYKDEHGIIKSKVKATTELKFSKLPRSMNSPMAELSLDVVLGALLDAGLDSTVFNSTRTGYCAAIGIPDIERIKVLVNNSKRASAFDIIKTVPTSATGALATHLNMRGPVYTVQHACASGLRSITQGMDLIRLGKADTVVCSAAEMVTHETMKGFDAMRALYRGDDLVNPSKPFSSDRSGFIFGEGAGAVVLESESHFLRRGGNKCYGSLVAYADYSDGGDITNPSGEGATLSMCNVYGEMLDNDINVDFISAHATSTPNGDSAEARAIFNVVGDNVPVVALKRLYGHLVTASAMVEFIHCLYMLKENFIVSNGDNVLDTELSNIQLPSKQITNLRLKGFIKNAFGFGGLNSVVGVSKYRTIGESNYE